MSPVRKANKARRAVALNVTLVAILGATLLSACKGDSTTDDAPAVRLAPGCPAGAQAALEAGLQTARSVLSITPANGENATAVAGIMGPADPAGFRTLAGVLDGIAPAVAGTPPDSTAETAGALREAAGALETALAAAPGDPAWSALADYSRQDLVSALADANRLLDEAGCIH